MFYDINGLSIRSERYRTGIWNEDDNFAFFAL